MRSIQRQLTFRILLAVLAIALAAGALLYFYARLSLVEEFDRTLAAEAKLVAGMVTCDEHGRLEFGASDAQMAEFRRPRKPSYFEIWPQTGGPFARSPSLGGKDLPQLPVSRKIVTVDLRLPDGRPGRAAAMRFTPRLDEDDPRIAPLPPTAGMLTLVVAQDRHELDETLGVLATSLALAAVALAGGAAIAVFISVRRGLRPLKELARQADSIGAGSLDQQFPTLDVPAELLPICHGLNKLLKRLSQAFARERRFTADAAHELRTPIAELRALAEVAIKWPTDASGEQNYRDALQIATHMESLVTALLALARCGAGAQSVALSNVDMARVVGDAWAPHEPVAASRRLVVEWDVADIAAVLSDRALLAPLVGNLLSNAVAYTPEGGRIFCRLARSANEVVLSLSNDCQGLSVEDLPRLFEPFWRKDPARGGATHTGLGLALVAAYADALGIRIKPNLGQDGVFSVVVSATAAEKNEADSIIPNPHIHGLVVGSDAPRIDIR